MFRGPKTKVWGVRPKLLFLCQTLPYPPDGGVHIRAFHLLRLLSETYDVWALCFYRTATRGTRGEVLDAEQGLLAEAKVVSIDSFPIEQEGSRLRFAWDHARSVLRGRVYTHFAYESKAFAHRLSQLLEDHDFDLIHVDSLDLSAHLESLSDRAPVVCDHHNVESALLKRRGREEANPLVGAYFRLQGKLMAREEAERCRRFSLNLTVSEADARQLKDHVPRAPVAVVPNGVDTTTFRPTTQSGEGIVFVGGYTWFPNREGMAYFCDRILPLIRERIPEVKVKWVGRAPSEVRRRFADQYRVELTGYVDDIRPHVASAGCFVVPLRVGGGTRLKILDAWAMGKAIVSTSIGCEGLPAEDGENILVRDDDEGFANAVVDTLQNVERRIRLGEAGRRTVESNYEWEGIGQKLTSMYQHLSLSTA